MHIRNVKDIKEPLVTPQGETIYELIGRAANHSSEAHSVAYITMTPGKASRKHYHPKSEESFYVLSGEAQVEAGTEKASLKSGDIVLIPPGTPHRIKNVSKTELRFLAVCVPAWEPSNTVWVEDP